MSPARSGTFGAAAACARPAGTRADRADADSARVAGTQAAGLKSMFGTMRSRCMRARPARAACSQHNSRRAASLSRHDVVECPQGFAATQRRTPLLDPDLARMDVGRRNLPDNQVQVVRHASCYQTCIPPSKPSVRCAPNMASPLRTSQRIHCSASGRRCRHGLQHIARPSSGLETKFSLQTAGRLAQVMAVDTADIDSYRPTNGPRTWPWSRCADKVEVTFIAGLADHAQRGGDSPRRRSNPRSAAQLERRRSRPRSSTGRPADCSTSLTRPRRSPRGQPHSAPRGHTIPADAERLPRLGALVDMLGPISHPESVENPRKQTSAARPINTRQRGHWYEV